MPKPNSADKLAEYERRYSEIAGQLPGIGLISSGSVTRRFTRCGTASCRCQADPPKLHGPYYQWTTKVKGKTVTRRLSPAEAALYQEWIANDRQLRRLVEQMREVAAKAAKLKLEEAVSRETGA
jgi:hypothetical protein